MKILHTPSGSASNTQFSKVSFPREFVEIAMLSALGWSICVLVAIYFARAGLTYLATEIVA